jgi:hypothetical protein
MPHTPGSTKRALPADVRQGPSSDGFTLPKAANLDAELTEAPTSENPKPPAKKPRTAVAEDSDGDDQVSEGDQTPPKRHNDSSGDVSLHLLPARIPQIEPGSMSIYFISFLSHLLFPRGLFSFLHLLEKRLKE